MFPPGLAKLGDYSGFDRVACQYHDGDITCCLLRCQRAGHIERHDHVDLEPDQLGRKLGKSIQPFFRGAKLEFDVSSLDIAELAQSFPESIPERLRVRDPEVERAYASHPGLLCARRERPR
jgi:hypothetical protein